MKPKDFSIPSMMVQNILRGSDEQQTFDSFKLKKGTRNSPKQSEAFTDCTNNVQIKQKKQGKKFKKLQPLKKGFKDQTVFTSFQLSGTLTEDSEQQSINWEFNANSLQKNANRDINGNEMIFGQKSNCKKAKIQNKFTFGQDTESFYQIDEKQENLNQKQKQQSDSGRKLQLDTKSLDSNSKEQNVIKSKKLSPRCAFQTKKSQNVCLNIQNSSQSQDDGVDSDKKSSERQKAQTKLKRINYDGSAIFKKVQSFKKDTQNLQVNAKQSTQPGKISNKEHFVKQIQKKDNQNILLVNFDDQSSQQDDSIVKAVQESANKIKINTSEDPLDMDQKPNIFLNDFGDSQDDQNLTQPHKNAESEKQKDDKDIELLKPINILQLVRLTSQNYAYEPIPNNCIFQTIIKRYSESQTNIVYELFDSSTYKSILKVQKCQEGYEIFSSKQWNSGIAINTKYLKINEQSSCALMKSNFFGTEFNCYKFNRNNQKPDFAKLNQLITIKYETNIFGLKGPRKMEAYIPLQNTFLRGQNNLHQVYESQKKQIKQAPMRIQKFINKTPKWNLQILAFVLNFNGRATVSSVKNFIMTSQEHIRTDFETLSNNVLFGKIQKNVFNLDIKHPFNLIQGLALALSSFEKKIGCQ